MSHSHIYTGKEKRKQSTRLDESVRPTPFTVAISGVQGYVCSGAIASDNVRRRVFKIDIIFSCYIGRARTCLQVGWRIETITFRLGSTRKQDVWKKR